MTKIFSLFLTLSLLIVPLHDTYAVGGVHNSVRFQLKPPNYFVGFNVEFSTPNFIPSNDTRFAVFIWPGLQPGPGSGPNQSQCFYPITHGILQPVLAFGNNTAPYKPKNVNQWRIGGQYVNDKLDCNNKFPNNFASVCENYANSHVDNKTISHGGPYLPLVPGQAISTQMTYDPSKQSWLQTIIAEEGQVQYSIPLNYCSKSSDASSTVTRAPQAQTLAILSVETHNYDKPLTQIFNNITLVVNVGDNSYANCDNTITITTTNQKITCTAFTMPASSDGLITCQIDSCTIKTPNA